jgi:hypothetical protein
MHAAPSTVLLHGLDHVPGSAWHACSYQACACQPLLIRNQHARFNLLLLVRWLQDLLESPHLTLELMSIMDTLPKNLDTVSMHVYRSKGTSLRRGAWREYKLGHRKACRDRVLCYRSSMPVDPEAVLLAPVLHKRPAPAHSRTATVCLQCWRLILPHCTLAALTSSNASR